MEQDAAFVTKTVSSTPSPRSAGRGGGSSSGSAIASAPGTATSAESRFIPGELLAGRYRIIALLGKGGMGEVYRADDLTLGQPVALKFLPESLAGNPDALARFRNEVRVARQVSHPNVCRVYDVGEVEGHFFLSMEYVDGEDLASLLRRIGRIPYDKALEIARRLCAGLAAAHDKGVLHRDLKPSNIMLDGRGQVLLTDFGLAGLAGDFSGGDVSSGTPAYMAPEQLAGMSVSVRSDIYALGLVLYEIFTGKRPFEASSMTELLRVRKQTAPSSLTTLVRDLDPAVERVILRCLESDPAKRPPSALAVAAALPGGDPLAAALAAGETPSPEMVAAAGEGVGLKPLIAVPVFVIIVASLIAIAAMMNRTGALRDIRPEFPPDVLAQKARDIVRKLGYGRGADRVYAFDWDNALVAAMRQHENPRGQWRDLLSRAPSPLIFWYRESPDSMAGGEFHDELLTPGLMDRDDPPPIMSGMVSMELDSAGRLKYFEAIPPQRQDPVKQPVAPVDWTPLLTAAGLDAAQLKSADPTWNFLAASDTRAAWTGTWPGGSRPLRVEAAALHGKPVAFSVIGDWTQPRRMPSAGSGSSGIFFFVVGVVAILICIGSALLARRNILRGQGDMRSAFRFAGAMFYALMALWLCQMHFVFSLATIGIFMLALCTAVFYGVVMWTIYLALEPFVRSRWPQTLVSWTTLWSGRPSDPVVGRDVLFGILLGMGIALLSEGLNLARMAKPEWSPDLQMPEMLLGTRAMLGGWLMSLAQGTRSALFFFFVLFLLRVVLRNQWLAAAAWTLLFTTLFVLGNNNNLLNWAANLLVFAASAVVVLRWGGLLALGMSYFVQLLLARAPVSDDVSAWFFGNAVFVFLSVAAIAAWAAYVAMAGRKLWGRDLFDEAG